MQIPSMPFKVLAMAPFQISGKTDWDAPPIHVDPMAIEGAMASMDVSAYISMPSELCPAGGLELRFRKLKDFHPDGLLQNNPFLSHLLEARHFLSDIRTKNFSEDQIRDGLNQWPDLPTLKIPAAIKKSPQESGPKPQAHTIDKILDMVALPGDATDSSSMVPADHISGGSNPADGIILQILDRIFGNDHFRDAEAAWCGLKMFVQQGMPRESNVELEVVPVTMNTLEGTLNRLTAHLIDDLPSMMIIDLPFDNSPFCMALLEKIAGFSETLMVPTVVQISSKFLQLASWNDIKRLSFIPHHLEQPAYAKWQALKDEQAANWLAVSCNRFLIRYPYGKNNLPRKSEFAEQQQPWIGAVWAVAGLVAQSFTKTGWPTGFTDRQNFRIENLALHSHAGFGEIPLETIFDIDRSDQFIRAGIMPLGTIANKDIVFLPKQTVITGISFIYQLFITRITQFILCCKAVFPGDLSAQDLENRLKQAFSRLWEITGHTEPEILEISAENPESGDRIALHIKLQPSCRILPNGESMIMDFYW